MLRTLRKAEYAELMILFFIQAAGMAIWFVPLGAILDAHGLHAIKPFAFAANAAGGVRLAADLRRHGRPACAAGKSIALARDSPLRVMMAVIGMAIQHGWNPWLVLVLIQLFSLTYAPMFSISTALVLARLEDAQKEFGSVRAMATLGWMGGAL